MRGTKTKSSAKTTEVKHSKQKKSSPHKITPTRVSKKKPVKVKLEDDKKSKTSSSKRHHIEKQNATKRRKVESGKPHHGASSKSRERSSGRVKATSPSSASKSSKKSSEDGFKTPPSNKSQKSKTNASSKSSKKSSSSARKKLFELPNPNEVNWQSSDDLVRIIIGNDKNADVDDVRAWSFKKKIAAVGKLYQPSLLIMPYGYLAREHNINIKKVDTTAAFRTRDKAVESMTDLIFKIIGKPGSDTK